MDDVSQDPWPSEAVYLDCLAEERHLFAWTLANYGGVPQLEAEARALRRYPFEPPEDKYRGLIFHNMAWHWAMLQLRGDMYWLGDREASRPPPEYQAEAERFRASVGGGSADAVPVPETIPLSGDS